jgi:hypothetical protein
MGSLFNSEIFKSFWLPTLVLLIPMILLLINRPLLKNKEIYSTVLGVMLGVTLGFGADILKRSLDDYNKKRDLRIASLNLLSEDAKTIYCMMWTYDVLLSNQDDLSKLLKQGVPPPFKLNYWSVFKGDKDFLLLAADEPFNSIFRQMRYFEDISQLIERAHNNDRKAGLEAYAVYNLTIKNKQHEELLLNFMPPAEIQNLRKKCSTY